MSAILSADDLNDFISPGVACIKPVETLPKQEDSNPYEVTTEDKLQVQNPAPASISLTDCLACSGCVTSAEAVLVSLQSHSEVLNTLDAFTSIDPSKVRNFNNSSIHNGNDVSSEAKLFVASVSPQVRASIAATYGISERRAGHIIEQFLSGSQGLRLGGRNKSGFSYVVDTNRLREACLVLGADEVTAALNDRSKARPVLTSACPGWICYAEKTHPHILPHLSALKSPQALTGTLLKSVLSKSLGISPSQIWHLSIMPCFDKKLEASREELTDKWWSSNSSNTPVRDVDCVITSRELLTLASARGVQLSSLPHSPLRLSEQPQFPDSTLAQFLFKPASSSRPNSLPQAGTSGGYLHHILDTFQSRNPGSTITTVRGRNADVVEYTLASPSSPVPILKCARYYGFRNIQNLVRKLKPPKVSRLPGAARRSTPQSSGTSEYAYVEVMACPGGCTNGGGQIKIEDVVETIPETRGEIVTNGAETNGGQGNIGNQNVSLSQKEWLARVDEAYFSASSNDDNDDDDDDDDNNDREEKSYTKYENGNGNEIKDTVMTEAGADADTEHIDGNPTSRKINGIDVDEIHSLMNHWAEYVDIPLGKLAYTTYRKVESDVGKSKAGVKKMGDGERIAAIAGLQGGGW